MSRMIILASEAKHEAERKDLDDDGNQTTNQEQKQLTDMENRNGNPKDNKISKIKARAARTSEFGLQPYSF